MSNYPPNGPPHPPPYGYPPHPGGFAYVPIPPPVMMPTPMYPPPVPEPPAPNPTYVTNYYYPPQSQPPVEAPTEIPVDPVQVVDDPNPIDWVTSSPNTASTLSHRAFVAGREGWDGSPLWVIRAHHGGELIPGKLAIKHRSAYIPHAGREIPVHNFEVLCAPGNILRWVPASDGQVPVGAIPGGNSHSGEPLYIARVNHLKSITPGKVHPSHGCCYISFGGEELPRKNYEVLCKIV